MLGFSYLVLCLILGVVLANRLLAEQPPVTRTWAGCLIGLLAAMWAPVPFAIFLGFTVPAHVAGLGLWVVVAFGLQRLCDRAIAPSPAAGLRPRPPADDRVLLGVAVGFAGVLCYLLATHILNPYPDGLHGGQSTFGDLPLHLGIVTSLAYQGVFPPMYSIFPGHLLSYPFLFNSLSSSLVVGGLTLRQAILVPSFITAFLLTLGFLIWARSLLASRAGAVLASVLFFLNGGLGFAYFLDGAAANPQNFFRLFSAFYQTPTNLVDQNIRWVNVICDMLVPQRTTLGGWTFLIFALWALGNGLAGNGRKYFILGGAVLGLLPMVHTHSFLALSVIAATWTVVYAVGAPDKRRYRASWAWFWGIAIALAVPQVLYWTVPQANEGHFVHFHFDWANRTDIWPWFWLKNLGVTAVLVFGALRWHDRATWRFYSGPLVLFAIADVVLFQTNEYDNNKLFFVWYMATSVIVGGYLARTFWPWRWHPRRVALFAGILFLAVFSASLSLAREGLSSLLMFDNDQVAAAEAVKQRTPANALFVTGSTHLNPMSSLAGRNIYLGASSFLFFHGLSLDTRQAEVAAMYKSEAGIKAFAPPIHADYLFVSPYERSQFHLPVAYTLAGYPQVYHNSTITIFALSPRAIALGPWPDK